MSQRRGWLFWFSRIIGGLVTIGLFYQLLLGGEGFLRREDIVYEYDIKELDYPETFKTEIQEARWRNVLFDFERFFKEKFKEIIVQWGKEHASRLKRAGLTLEDFVWVFAEADAVKKFPISQREEIENVRDDAAIDIMARAMPEMEISIRAAIPQYKIEYEVINVGRREAKHVNIKIDPGEEIYSAEEPFSENEINKFEVRDKIILIELNRLSPRYSVEGSLWCTKIENEPPLFVSFEGGTGRRKDLFSWFISLFL